MAKRKYEKKRELYTLNHKPQDVEFPCPSEQSEGAGAPDDNFVQEMAEYVEAQTECGDARAWFIADYIVRRSYRRKYRSL